MTQLRKKLLVFFGTILILLTFAFGKALHNPHSNLTMMSAGVDLGSGFCKYTKDFYVIVLCTEHLDEFNGTKYVVILRNEKDTKIDLIRDAGINSVVSLSGKTATKYLEEKEFDLSSFDETWASKDYK